MVNFKNLYLQEPEDDENMIKSLIKNNKRAIALGIAVAITFGTAGLIYYAIDDDDDEDNYYYTSDNSIPSISSGNYYFSRGSALHTGTWSRTSSALYSSRTSSGYSAIRGGISG